MDDRVCQDGQRPRLKAIIAGAVAQPIFPHGRILYRIASFVGVPVQSKSLQGLLIAEYRPNARWHTGRDARDRHSGRQECRLACGSHFGYQRRAIKASMKKFMDDQTAAVPRGLDAMNKIEKIKLPGRTLGVFGGGQLGRMFARMRRSDSAIAWWCLRRSR